MAKGARQFSDVGALVDSLELQSVDFIELHAERVPAREVESGVVDLGVASEGTPDALVLSFRCILHHREAEVIAAVQCRYVFTQTEGGATDESEAADAMPEPLVREFVEKVAVMAAYPFLRQGIHTLVSMLGIGGVTLGLLKAGRFSLGDPAAARGSEDRATAAK